MDELDRLRRAAERVAVFDRFTPDQRVWWLELRQAVEYYLRRLPRDRHPDLSKAYRLVHDMPEFKPDEAKRWWAFRQAVETALKGGS